MKKIAIASLLAAVAFGAVAQTTAAPAAPAAFELKGYAIGAELSACPAGFETSRKGVALTRCISGNQTIAGKNTNDFMIEIYKGKIASVIATGMESPIEVAEALKVKFGRPTQAKDYIREYVWMAPGDSQKQMKIKAYASSTSVVVLRDWTLYEAAVAENAKSVQSDL